MTPRLVRFAMIALMLAPGAAASGEQESPARLAVTETTRVDLMLVDVDVLDAQGRPVRGLTLDDFDVKLDYGTWPVFSVDDLCSPDSPVGPAVRPAPVEPGAPAASGAPRAAEEPAGEPVSIVFYFDLAQLQTAGRDHAIAETRRWVEEEMRPGDRGMIVTFSRATGLQELAHFTHDTGELSSILEGMAKDRSMLDPFPSFRVARQIDCDRYEQMCRVYAFEEYEQGLRGYGGLKRFIQRLEAIPGRKAIIYFDENGSLSPGSLYGEPDGHHGLHRRVEEIGAEATLSRASFYPAGAGVSTEVGRRLAMFSGGFDTSRLYHLGQVLRQVRERSSCTYRIGLVPPESSRRTIYPLDVEVRGKSVMSSRVLVLSEQQRWLRQARAVLSNPASARDLPVAAGLVPLSAEKGRWSFDVQVVVDVDSLVSLPAEHGRTGMWEVGAVLVNDRGGSWELFADSTVNSRNQPRGLAVAHVQTFVGMKPGEYRLVAYVRDRVLNVFGGAEASLRLPDPREGGIAGPVMLRKGRPAVISELPLAGRGADTSSRATEVADRVLVVNPDQVFVGDRIVFASWSCAGDRSGAPRQAYLSAGDAPVGRFDAPRVEAAGACVRQTDRFMAVPPSGNWTYHLLAEPEVALDFSLHAATPLTGRP